MIFQLLLVFVVLFAITATFAVAAWLVYPRYHLIGLSLLWIASSLLYGFLSFRVVCSRPVTCDLGSDPYSMGYLLAVAPPFALAAAAAFGAISVIIVLRSRRAPGPRGPISDLVLATLTGAGTFLIVAPILRTPVW